MHAAHLQRAMQAAIAGLRQVPTREQLAGALALLDGCAIEMETGEGKTLTTFLAASVTALRGRRVMVLCANDYLSARDAEALAPGYAALGLRVAGVAAGGQYVARKQSAYAAHVVYVSLREAVFDWLRDQTRRRPWHNVQRFHDVAYVDEIDAGLLDQALVPLTLSTPDGPVTTEERERLAMVERAVASLAPERDYLREGTSRATLTSAGWLRIEARLRDAGALPADGCLFGEVQTGLEQLVTQALHAHVLLERGRHYVVKDDAVALIDSSTGRLAATRRWGEGLHRAVQQKERLPITPHPRSLASTSARAFLSRFEQVAGGSGTIGASAEELYQLLGTPTVRLPTHRPSQREDMPERVFTTHREREAALCEAARHARERGQPLLVGTWSELDAGRVSTCFREAGIAHVTLAAQDEAVEAAVVADAARLGAVTVATLLAGRGTDILLGGASATAQERAAVVAVGGLRVVLVGRSDCARHDQQLRGRAGRQGDPGVTCTWISHSDELVQGLGTVSGTLSAALDKAQARVERQRMMSRAARAELEPVLEMQRAAFAVARDSVLWGIDPEVVRRWLASGHLHDADAGPSAAHHWWAEGVPARVAREFDAVVAEGGDLRQFLVVVFARFGVALRARDLAAHATPVRAAGQLVRHGMWQTVLRATDDVAAHFALEQPVAAAREAAVALVDARLRHSAPRHFVRVARAHTLVALDTAWADFTSEVPSLMERANVERAARDSRQRAFRRLAHQHFVAHWDAARRSIGQTLADIPMPSTDGGVTALCEQQLHDAKTRRAASAPGPDDDVDPD